jgi:hypothetical protein
VFKTRIALEFDGVKGNFEHVHVIENECVNPHADRNRGEALAIEAYFKDGGLELGTQPFDV